MKNHESISPQIDIKTEDSVVDLLSGLWEKNPTLTRRKFLWGTAVLAGAGALTALGCFPKSQETQPPSIQEPHEFRGERRQTRELLMEWAKEVNNKPDKIEKYLPKIANLAIAYFSSEMSNMFPDRKHQYGIPRYNNKIEFLNRESFFKKLSECGRPINPNDIGAVHIDDDRIYINKEPSLHNKRIEVYFFAILHELGHFSPPRKEYPQGKQIKGIPDLISDEKGLLAYTTKEILRCGTTYRFQIEETVVHHLTTKLAVGLGLYVTGVAYDEWVKIYEDKVITQLFSGGFKELLSYHQETKPEEFFQSIGRRAFSESISPQAQQDFGDVYIRRLFLQ